MTGDLANFLAAWTPVLLIMILAVGFKRQALELALWGTSYTFVLVLFWFSTPANVVLLAGLDGLLTNLPLLLVIYFGMLLAGLLLDTGSLARVVEWFSKLTKDRWHSTLMIAVGSGNFMEGAGIVAEPIIAPMLRAAGLPATGSAALSIAGYAGLMILELGGAILSVLALVTGLDSANLGREVALLSLPATLLLVLAIPWLLNEPALLKDRFFSLVAVGSLAGGGALFAAHYVGASVAGLFGGIVVLVVLPLAGPRQWNLDRAILLDMAPLLFLVACLFTVNLIKPVRAAVVMAFAGKVSVAPGHVIKFRPFFSAYTYIFCSYIFALLLVRDRQAVWRNFVATNRRAWRPVMAMALFGVAGQMIAYSGYQTGFAHVNPALNIPLALANGVVELSGDLYPLFAPLIGWVGTFLTGYGTASIVLFGKLQVDTAELLEISPVLLASGMAVGSAVGSISSPLKIALAAPMCGAQGKEGEILRRTIPLGLGICLLLGILLLLL